MEHTCQDCSHQFTVDGQNEPHISPAAQCPVCHSYRTQPSGMPDEQNEMTHTMMGMPASDQDDMSGNPLDEGFMGDWKDRSVRDESFGSGMTSNYKLSLFDVPTDFETQEVTAPQGLAAAHQTTIQTPNGITDNLHAALGNLGAWVESPHENGQLRPYSNSYWKSIRPQFMKPGSLRIGVQDPIMAEIINHVAQKDDLTPLYQYRGRTSSLHKQAIGPWDLMALPAIGDLMGGTATQAGGDAASAAGNDVAGTSAGDPGGAAGGPPGVQFSGQGINSQGSPMSGIGGALQKVMPNFLKGGEMGVGSELAGKAVGLAGKWGDDLLGMGGTEQLPQQQANPTSFFASAEDDANPDSHDEIPKNDDGDSKEQDDGNSHEWQRDISVNDGGGSSQHSPQFNPGGPAIKQFMMAVPLLLQYLESGEDGSNDPMLQELHKSLDAEIPGYIHHADEAAGHQMMMILKGTGGMKNEPDHTDENSGGKRESSTASLYAGNVTGGDFLPDLEVGFPFLRTAAPPMMPPPGMPPGGGPPGMPPPGMPPMGGPPGMPPGGMPPASPMSGPPPMGGTPPAPGGDPLGNQGPSTDQQQAEFARYLEQQGRDKEIPGMIANPQAYADEFAAFCKKPIPPQHPDSGAAQQQPPMPPQEEAPPEDTMPVPGMSAQSSMRNAVAKYAADSIAGKCPNCGSHTTELLDEEGNSHCQGCQNIFKSDMGVADKVHPGNTTASTHWNVDIDYRKVADAATQFSDASSTDSAQPQGPISDQQNQMGGNPEGMASGHTWTDETGNPLKTGQEYEMYSGTFDIPDHVRIEAVKPSSVVLTYVNRDFGLEHSDELTKKEADLEGTRFKSSDKGDELGPDDTDSFEQNNDDNTGFTGPGARDQSQPDSVVSSVMSSGVDRENPNLAWLQEGMRTAGAQFTPMEQRALIEESGMARNSDMLDLLGTHYLQDEGEGYEQFAFGW